MALWAVLVRARRGCRCIVDPVNVGTGLEHPLMIGSFSISLTSIFLVLLAKLRELRVSRWYDRTGARLRIMTVSPLFCPIERIRVIFDSRYGIRACFLLIASTHWARTNKLLFMLADSTSRSFPLSVLRLSSDPARSMAEAVLKRISSPVVMLNFTQSTACDLDEWALSCHPRVSIVSNRGRTYGLPLLHS